MIITALSIRDEEKLAMAEMQAQADGSKVCKADCRHEEGPMVCCDGAGCGFWVRLATRREQKRGARGHPTTPPHLTRHPLFSIRCTPSVTGSRRAGWT